MNFSLFLQTKSAVNGSEKRNCGLVVWSITINDPFTLLNRSSRRKGSRAGHNTPLCGGMYGFGVLQIVPET
jgi:hypothetical protein